MGHGHVIPNPDGKKARCGGPGFCNTCAKEAGLPSAAAYLREHTDMMDQLIEEKQKDDTIAGHIHNFVVKIGTGRYCAGCGVSWAEIRDRILDRWERDLVTAHLLVMEKPAEWGDAPEVEE